MIRQSIWIIDVLVAFMSEIICYRIITGKLFICSSTFALWINFFVPFFFYIRKWCQSAVIVSSAEKIGSVGRDFFFTTKYFHVDIAHRHIYNHILIIVLSFTVFYCISLSSIWYRWQHLLASGKKTRHLLSTRPSMNKLLQLLSNENKALIRNLSVFIKKGLNIKQNAITHNPGYH